MHQSSTQTPSTETATAGVPFAILAYTVWGFLPAYWKLLQGTSHAEVLANRIFWAAVFFSILLIWKNRKKAGKELQIAFNHWKALLLCAVLVSSNWFLYIYAVNSGQVLESSLGYFINPLVNVLLGRVFLGEKLSPVQKIAVGLAAIGVLQLTFHGDHFPWIALVLAFSFGFYGLIRKQISISALSASSFESILLALPALGTIFALRSAPAAEPYAAGQWMLLAMAGAVTALPLLWFAEAAKRLPLSTLGLIQYLAPTLQFSLAVFAYGEPFSAVHGRSFAFIWAGLALYSFHLFRGARKRRIELRLTALQTSS